MKLDSALASARSSVPPALAMVEDTVNSIGRQTSADPYLDSVVCRSLLRAGQALDSVDLLAARYRYQDMWALCRIICEVMINGCYLQIAPTLELQRWSNYDLWTDKRVISNLISLLPEFEEALDANQLESQRAQRQSMEEEGLYKGLRGSWSDRSLEQRAKAVDEVLKLERDAFQLLSRLTVKVGHSFIHASPKGIGRQSNPVLAQREPAPEEIQACTQALSMSATAVYAGITFTRHQKGLSPHPLANQFGDVLRIAFDHSLHRSGVR